MTQNHVLLQEDLGLYTYFTLIPKIHRIIEQSELEDHLIPTPCHRQRHLPLDQWNFNSLILSIALIITKMSILQCCYGYHHRVSIVLYLHLSCYLEKKKKERYGSTFHKSD